MRFPTPTDDEIAAGIEEAIAEAVKRGILVDTGRTKWSERKRCMIPVYRSAVYLQTTQMATGNPVCRNTLN
jgi:hypothetical protein